MSSQPTQTQGSAQNLHLSVSASRFFLVIYRRLLYKAISRLTNSHAVHAICRHCPPLSQPFTKRTLLDQHIQLMHDVNEPESRSQGPAAVESQPNKVHTYSYTDRTELCDEFGGELTSAAAATERHREARVKGTSENNKHNKYVKQKRKAPLWHRFLIETSYNLNQMKNT